MITTFKATAKKLSEGMQVDTESSGFRILFDEPEKMGGTNKGINPMSAMLSVLGGCQAIVAQMFAKQFNIEFSEFHLEIEGDMDMAGIMQKKDVRPGFQEIRFKMHFKSDNSIEDLEKFSEFIEKNCPISDSLAHGVRMVNQGVVID
ncbi:MAG: OsmC family protein [Candidatus Izemoplasmatales bacterium]|nr:OsmC family protein [Candidatus Izemoplasmatales bacterium]MDY0138924.1 OsmC family protein [Candidatus Izemoplasmatales bacterium]